MTEPNKQQQELIESTEGIYLVDAGAGTGKTFTITRRYANIIERRDAGPEDIFLATFTNNAADQMKERIIERTDIKASRIYDAPISTFHSFAKKLIRNHGSETPRLLGIEEDISQNVSLMESQVREKQEFSNFMNVFTEENPEYQEFYQIIDDQTQLLELLKNLAAKGIIPEKQSWFGNSEKYLDGDFEDFKQVFKEMNRPRETSNGKKQSELRSRLYTMKYKDFEEDAPDLEDIRGGYGTKQVRRDFCRKAFKEDREELKEFIHDVYTSYLRYSLRRNYLNFNFLLVLAYVLLSEDHSLREELSFEYLMIDEFQDTNEIQFKLSLLLAEKPNICAVGDWKQSIYSFQYANVENIQRFRNRLERYREELNQGRNRVNFEISDIEEIRLKKNYRSTQKILDLSEEALCLPATEYENLPADDIKSRITSLESQKDSEGETEKLLMEEEVENVLARIQELVKEQEDTEYGDIAVLTRTRNFGLELQKKAQEKEVPVAYEGGVELFKTNPAIILLAWMRILNSNSERGWAVVLENAGYTLDEAERILEKQQYPEEMTEFREELEETSDIAQLSEEVFQKYGVKNGFTEKITEVLSNTFENSYMNLGQLIQFVEDNIEDGEIYEVDNSMQENVVKIQTIHAAKGLEYPIVFVSDINQSRFPSTNGDYMPIEYRDTAGIRTRKKYRKEQGFAFDNWRTEILFQALSKGYDEERRLMYVAMTRAEEQLYLTAEKGKASTFFEELPLERKQYSKAPSTEQISNESENFFEPDIKQYILPKSRTVTETVELDKKGEGREKGLEIHRFARKYVESEIQPETEYQERLKKFIDSLEGDLTVEIDLKLPLDDVVLQGRADLLVEKEDLAEFYDFKIGDKEPEKYRKQLSIYAHAYKEACSSDVNAYVYCVSSGELREIEVMNKDELTEGR